MEKGRTNAWGEPTEGQSGAELQPMGTCFHRVSGAPYGLHTHFQQPNHAVRDASEKLTREVSMASESVREVQFVPACSLFHQEERVVQMTYKMSQLRIPVALTHQS